MLLLLLWVRARSNLALASNFFCWDLAVFLLLYLLFFVGDRELSRVTKQGCGFRIGLAVVRNCLGRIETCRPLQEEKAVSFRPLLWHTSYSTNGSTRLYI